MQVGAFNRQFNYQLEEIYHTIFFLWEGRFLYEKLELRLPVIYNITAEEWICRPAVSYMPADGIKLTAGFNGFYGPEGSLFDLVGPVLNAGYFSMKLTF